MDTELVLKSFEAHMKWILPRIQKSDNRGESDVARIAIVTYLIGDEADFANVLEKANAFAFSTKYGYKTYLVYKEIYDNMSARFSGNRTINHTIERIL